MASSLTFLFAATCLSQTLLHLIVEQDAFGSEEPGSTMQLLLQLGFQATLNGLLLRKWHQVVGQTGTEQRASRLYALGSISHPVTDGFVWMQGLFESSGLLALPRSMPLHEADEVTERNALQTHEHIIALCSAIGKQFQQTSKEGAAGEESQLGTIIDAVLDMFHG